MASDGEDLLGSWCEDNIIDMEAISESEWKKIVDEIDDDLEMAYTEVADETMKEWGPILRKKLRKYGLKQ